MRESPRCFPRVVSLGYAGAQHPQKAGFDSPRAVGRGPELVDGGPVRHLAPLQRRGHASASQPAAGLRRGRPCATLSPSDQQAGRYPSARRACSPHKTIPDLSIRPGRFSIFPLESNQGLLAVCVSPLLPLLRASCFHAAVDLMTLCQCRVIDSDAQGSPPQRETPHEWGVPFRQGAHVNP